MRKSLWLTMALVAVLITGVAAGALADQHKQELYRNNTGQTAYDLTKILWGYHQVTSAYHGSFQNHIVLHFGIFTIIHWYNPWTPIPPGGTAWACFSVRDMQRIRVLGAWWTDANGNFIGRCGPNLSQGPRHRIVDGVVHLVFGINHEANLWTGTVYPPVEGDGAGAAMGPFQVISAYYVNTGTTQYTMDQLNETLYTSLTWTPLPGSFYLSHGQSYEWDLGTGVPIGDNIIVRFQLQDGTELADDMMQFQNRELPNLPGLSTWGLIALVVLLLASGSWVLLRRRQSATLAA